MKGVSTLAAALLVVLAAVRAEETYSSFACDSVPGADPTDLGARTCVLHNVCVESAGRFATWAYYVDPERPQDVPLLDPVAEEGDVAALGHRSGHFMHVHLVRGRGIDTRAAGMSAGRTTAVLCAPTNDRAHFLLDGMFGLHWMLRHHGRLDRATTDVLNVCRASAHQEHLRGLFTDTAPGIATGLPPTRSHAQTTAAGTRGEGGNQTDFVGKCFETVVVGPAGHYALRGLKTKDKTYGTAEDYDSFRDFLLVC